MKVYKNLSNPSIQLLLFLIGFWTVQLLRQGCGPQKPLIFRSNRPEVLFKKRVLKMCCKFTGERSCPCLSVISIKLLSNWFFLIFIFLILLLWNVTEVKLRHECFPVNLLQIFRTSFLKNTSGRLLLNTRGFSRRYSVLKVTVQNPIRNRSNCIDGFESFLCIFIFIWKQFLRGDIFLFLARGSNDIILARVYFAQIYFFFSLLSNLLKPLLQSSVIYIKGSIITKWVYVIYSQLLFWFRMLHTVHQAKLKPFNAKVSFEQRKLLYNLWGYPYFFTKVAIGVTESFFDVQRIMF